jgi:hypothetical protein
MTDVTVPVPGIVSQVDGVSWQDMRSMDWGTFPGLGACLVKMIHVDEDSVPWVMAVWLPPGKLPVPIPHRHYHATVYEQAFHLTGDLPHGEWASEDDDHELVVFRAGYFLDRRPGSLHGLDHMYSDSGAIVLSWRSGVGNWVDEPNADEETVHVKIGDGFRSKGPDEVTRARPRDGIVLDRAGCRVIDTRDMEWEPLGSGQARVRVLARDAAGEPSVRIVFLPPGDAGGEALPVGPDDREFAVVLEGEYLVPGADGPLTIKEGFAMNRAPGAPEGLVAAGSSPTGAVVLNWRMGPDTFPGV